MVINLFRKYIIGIFYENESLSDNKYENEKNVELLSFFKIKLDRNFFFKCVFAFFVVGFLSCFSFYVNASANLCLCLFCCHGFSCV